MISSFTPDVPVTDPIYFKKAKVAASDLSDTNSINSNFSFVVILGFSLYSASDPRFNLVGVVVFIAVFVILIDEVYSTSQLMSESTKDYVFNCVTQTVPSYRLFMFLIVNLSIAFHFKVNGIHVGMCRKLVIPMVPIRLFRPQAKKTRSRRLMQGLF